MSQASGMSQILLEEVMTIGSQNQGGEQAQSQTLHSDLAHYFSFLKRRV